MNLALITPLNYFFEQAKRYALEQEIVDLQTQVDKIKLVPGGVWGGSEAASGGKGDSWASIYSVQHKKG